MSTKEQERKALAQIRDIVKSLGADSYVGTALEGCLEIAEENITNDFLCSMQQRFEKAEKQREQAKQQCGLLEKQLKEAERSNTLQFELLEEFRAKLEKEEEWEAYIGDEVTQEDYDKLKEVCKEPLSKEKAVRYISDEFGFSPDRVEILNSRRVWEVNRHGKCRYSATEERLPYYYASDWNYVRFICCGITYEAVNGDLNNVTC